MRRVSDFCRTDRCTTRSTTRCTRRRVETAVPARAFETQNAPGRGTRSARTKARESESFTVKVARFDAFARVKIICRLEKHPRLPYVTVSVLIPDDTFLRRSGSVTIDGRSIIGVGPVIRARRRCHEFRPMIHALIRLIGQRFTKATTIEASTRWRTSIPVC